MKWKPDWTDIADNLLIGLMAVAAAAIFIVFCVCTWKDVTTERTIIMRDGSQSYACTISDISPTPIRLQANRGHGGIIMWFKRKHNEYGCPMCGRLPVLAEGQTEKYYETLKAVKTTTIYRLQCPRKHLSTNWYSDPMDASINWKHVVNEYKRKDTK